MSNIKMIFKNTLQLKRVYLTYFCSLLLTSTIYLTYIYFINTTITFVQVQMKVEISTFLMVLIYLLFIGLTFFIILLMYIANKMLFSIRSKEYANYRMIGIHKKKLHYLIFIEQFIMIVIAFIIAYFSSILCTKLSLHTLEQYIATTLDVEVNLSIELISPIFIILIAILIATIITYAITHLIYKKEMIDLLVSSTNNENSKPEKKYVKIKFLIIFSINIIYMISFLDFSTRINSVEFLLYLGVYLILLFLTIVAFGEVLAKLIPKKYYYHKANSFTQSIITSTMSYNLRIISLTTILFTISISAFTFSVMNLASISQSQFPGDYYARSESELIDFEYQDQYYSYLYTYHYPSNTPFLIGDEDFNQQTGLDFDLHQNQAIALSSEANNYYNYDIVNTLESNQDGFIVDQDIVKTDEQIKQEVEEAGGEIFIYDSIYNYNNSISIGNKNYKMYLSFISESQYELLTNQTIDVDPNYLYLLTNEQIKNPISIQFFDNYNEVTDTYKVKTNAKADVFDQLDTLEFLVYDDSRQEELLRLDNSEYRTTYIIRDLSNNGYQVYRDIFGDQNYLHNNQQENADAFLMYILLWGSLIIISLLILIIILTMLGLKAVSEGIFSKNNYKNLKQLNYPKQEINKIANQLTAIYFFIPLIIGVITSSYFMILFFEYSKSFAMISGALLNDTLINSLTTLYISLFILYFLYYLIVNYNYKRIVEL